MQSPPCSPELPLAHYSGKACIHSITRVPSLPPFPSQLEIEKKLRTLLTKEKEKAEEEATLAMGLCTGSSMLP